MKREVRIQTDSLHSRIQSARLWVVAKFTTAQKNRVVSESSESSRQSFQKTWQKAFATYTYRITYVEKDLQDAMQMQKILLLVHVRVAKFAFFFL